jgi:hypothetical protein
MELLTLAIPMLLYAAAFGALRFAKRVAFVGYCFAGNNGTDIADNVFL